MNMKDIYRNSIIYREMYKRIKETLKSSLHFVCERIKLGQ